MSRKFTIGRQNELSLNQEMHDLLMSLKYINNGPSTPQQDYQTPIPLGSIWNDNNRGKNILKVNTANNGWEEVFKGFYHPADLFTKPLSPVHGQLWIDGSKDNTLHFYDQNTNTWIAVRAAQTTSNQILVDTHNNFMHMYPLKDMDSVSEVTTKSFLVPYEEYGKLTNDGLFIHPSSDEYEVLSEISVKFHSQSEKGSWVHVNPHKLFTMEKKLVKVETTGPDAYKIYGLYDHNTEFFYLDSNNKWMHMIPYSTANGIIEGDFKPFDKGIEIISSRAKASEFVMMYAYSFYDTAIPGKMIRKDFNIGSNAELQIGLSTAKPLMFFDGLYLEQNSYNYDDSTGIVTLNDEITNQMDVMSIVFEKNETIDFSINQTIDNTNDILIGTLTNEYEMPMVFVSGVMGAELFGPEQLTYNKVDKTITIKNWGPHPTGETYYAMVVEGISSYVCHGYLDSTRTIYNETITNNGNEEYMLWMDGLLISSKDLDVSEGEVKVANAIEGMEYLLLKINNQETTALMFDGKAMNFTVAIKNEDGTLYNECNNACVFVDGHAVMMADTVYRETIPVKGANKQIIKIKNTDDSSSEVYTYYSYNMNNAKWEVLSEDIVTKVEALIKADYSSGTIMIDSPEGTKGTYYAYTYANGVEEPLLVGHRSILKDKTEYSVNVKHKFNINQGALSVYTNKLLDYNVIEEKSNIGKFILPIYDNEEFYNNGSLMYIVERPEKTESVSCVREVLTAANRNTQYSQGYTTTISLVPGYVNVYVNGVHLERSDFTVVDEYTLILHTTTVGGQRNYDSQNEDTWNKYLYYDKTGEHEITCLRDDYIMVEVRQDYDLKTQTIPVRYPGQRTFYIEDDGIPKSLILSQDYIKIFIDGIIYTGEYIINKENGSITLIDSTLEGILNVDPISRYFELNPDKYDEYLEEYKKPYISKPQTNRITFEWR